MELNDEEIKKLPLSDALCLRAYVESIESIKEYEKKIKSLDDDQEISMKLLTMIKETHQNYSNILLHILAEMPVIKDTLLIENAVMKPKPKKKKIKVKR